MNDSVNTLRELIGTVYMTVLTVMDQSMSPRSLSGLIDNTLLHAIICVIVFFLETTHLRCLKVPKQLS